MQKYLIRFSYFGTHFRGLQVQNRTNNDYQTIQGVLEAGLRYLRPANEPVAHTASRTDAGVHALDNCFHVELLPKYHRSPYTPSYITNHLNTFLRSAGVDIRVKSTQKVSPAFDARHCVIKRHYLYRMALYKQPLASPFASYDHQHIGENYWPLPEVNRVSIVRKAVDMTKLLEGCALLQRNADFASFMAPPAKNKPPPGNTVRNLEKVCLSPGQPLTDVSFDPAYSNLDFYNLTFTSRSFLHNQIRRCVGVLLALAQGVITKDQVELMFQNPRPASAPAGVNMSPACGLYLLKVDYPDHVLQPDYCGDVESAGKVLQWVDVRTRMRTMIALGHSNFQRENSDVDKFCNGLRRLDDLRDSILKEGVNEQCSSESINEDDRSMCAEHNIDDYLKAQNEIKSLSKLEKPSIKSHTNEIEVNLSSIDNRKSAAKTSGRSYIMKGSKKRRMLDEAYTLLTTRDEIDEKMRVLMEPLIRANRMNRSCYDEEEMEKAIQHIVETRRVSREVSIRLAEIEQLNDPLSNNKSRKRDAGDEDGMRESVQTGEK